VDAYSPPFSKATTQELANRLWQNFLGIGVTLGEAVSESREYWRYRFQFRGQRFPILKLIPQRSFYIPLALLGGLVLGGIIVFVRQGEVFIPVYISISVLLLCATPWPEQFRRYLPRLLLSLASLFSCVLRRELAANARPKLSENARRWL
jgi:hypothetical protein